MKLFDWLNDEDDSEPPSSPLLSAKLASLKDTPVKSVMVPRALINALDADVQLRRVRRLKSLKVAYLPVYQNDLDHVLGWIAKTRAIELMVDPNEDVRLAEHVRPLGFVAEDMPAAHLADAFLKAGSPLLIVRNDAGVTTGLVPLADMVELIFGFPMHEPAPVIHPSAPAPGYEL